MNFVTGASGLLGSHIIQSLVAKGKTVRALYRNQIPSFKGAEKVQWVEGDLLDIISLEAAIEGALAPASRRTSAIRHNQA